MKEMSIVPQSNQKGIKGGLDREGFTEEVTL